MTLSDVLPILGLPILDPAVSSLLKRITSSDRQPVLPEDEYSAYLEDKEKGFCLLFSDEAVAVGIENQVIGTGPLYLTGIFLYGAEVDGYKKFENALPFRITFESNQKMLTELFGKADWERISDNGTIEAERWDKVAPFSIHVTYSPLSGLVGIVSLFIPDGFCKPASLH